MESPVQIGRLAMRHEGKNWSAYYAMPNTMEGAIFLGSIRMGAVVRNQGRKQAFILMMQGLVADLIEEKVGTRPDFTAVQPAPEHERAGNG